MIPKFKVSVIHSGTTTDYESEAFSSINVKRRENNYDVATLWAENKDSKYYLAKMDALDEIKIYFKYSTDASYTQVFGGHIRQINPRSSMDGYMLQLLCKGYGVALEETHCKSDYGAESSHPSLDTAKEIWQDIVDNYINKSLGSANNTGYAITTTKIADIVSGTPIKYVNNPYRTSLDAVNLICDLTSAIGGGSTAGAHWIVDNSKNLIINTIAAHENTTEWPDWWNIDEEGSTLTEGTDFTGYAVLDKSEEFANNVVLITDFRRPAYDYWTEDSGGAALWGNDALEAITNDNTNVVVGSHSLKFDPNGAVAGYGYYPGSANAEWDITAWGSEKTIPRLNFYAMKHSLTTATTYVYLSTNDTARKTDYFYTSFLNWASEADDTWYHKSIPIGPYWASVAETLQFRWSQTGSPRWTDIDTVEFMVSLAGDNGWLKIDDLHFSGRIIRSAKNSTNITANKEYQKVLISRYAMDDSCIAADDTGFAARIAYAELLRRQVLPTTISFTIIGKPAMMAGQKCKVQACKKADGTYAIDSIMRITELQHDFASLSSFLTTVTATTDVKNTHPISRPDQYGMWLENMFLKSDEAKNIRAGAEVDVLIPILQKNYP
jgi:hypothetical protein